MTAAVTQRAAILLLVSLPALPANALEIRSQPTPGGVVQIDLQRADQPRPQVTLGERPVMLIKKNNFWRAIIGIGLHSKPGEFELQVSPPTGDRRTVVFNIAAKEYAVQRLQIANARKVNPAAEDLPRIESESRRIRKAKQSWTDSAVAERFVLPVKGRKSSSFGLRRILNGEHKRPHGGMDIAARTGTPVSAPAAGTVIEIGDFFYTGNTVILDHGQGLISLYAHLHKSFVRLGQQLQSGDLLGHIGATGRVTGAHLHWAVGLNGEWIDPQLLLR